MDEGRWLRHPLTIHQGRAHFAWRRGDGNAASRRASDLALDAGLVENVAHAIGLATVDERATGRIYNVGEAKALTEAEWVQAIAQAAGWRGRIVRLPRSQLAIGVGHGV